MSLFGTSPENSPRPDSAQAPKSSLFADDPPAGTNPPSASLFADEGPGTSASWSNKRAARHELVKTLLPATDVPKTYIEAYDQVLSAGDGAASEVGLTAVREILSDSGLSATDQDKIFSLVSSSGESDSATGLGRSEFNVLLALMGLAQEGEELTLDTVDDRRQSELHCVLDCIYSN